MNHDQKVAYNCLSSLWRMGVMSEADARSWMKSEIGVDVEEMSDDQCERVIELVDQKTRPTKPNMSATRKGKVTAIEPASTGKGADGTSIFTWWKVTMSDFPDPLPYARLAANGLPVRVGTDIEYTITKIGERNKMIILPAYLLPPNEEGAEKPSATHSPEPPAVANTAAHAEPPKKDPPADKAPPPAPTKGVHYKDERERNITRSACVRLAIEMWPHINKTVLGGREMEPKDFLRIADEIELYVNQATQ